jgi:hypothetical protein
MKFSFDSVVIVCAYDAVYRHTSIDIETTICGPEGGSVIALLFQDLGDRRG